MSEFNHGFAITVEQALKEAGYSVFFDWRKEPGPRATKFMAERTVDGHRGITCVISHVDYWSYTLIWFPGTVEDRAYGRFDSAPELVATLNAAWRGVKSH